MPERAARALADTSALIDLGLLDPAGLPTELAISALSLAELTAGPLATDEPAERSRRLDRLQRIEALFDPIPFDADAARSFGPVYAAVAASGRKARGQRVVDLMIAATALSRGLPLLTRNPDDLASLEDLVTIVPV